ncbi:MAG TPA: ABC transporter ATP-binding protein [Holophaga sp.]|nr:ABC transporter ATP-binding protein [Holophaga sp.]
MPEPLLRLRGLTKRYRAFTLQEASLDLPPGSLMGLLGPNGAGKTTLLKAILGLVRLDAGTLTFQGRDLAQHGAELRRRIAFVPDTPAFQPGARLATLKEAHAPFYPGFDETRWKGLMADFGLDPRRKAQELSLGQRTRFALTLALAQDWDLLVLDEPTTGLDPVFRRELLQRFSEALDERRAILFSTHITSDLEDRADFVTFVRDGQVVLSDTQEAIKGRWGVVKGELDLLDEPVRRAFKGLRETPHGFEALTDNLPGTRAHFGEQALVERPSLEDLLVLLGRKAHA